MGTKVCGYHSDYTMHLILLKSGIYILGVSRKTGIDFGVKRTNRIFTGPLERFFLHCGLWEQMFVNKIVATL